MEENNVLAETYQNGLKELQTVILQLEEQLKEQNAKQDALRSEIEKLKAELTEKAVLQTCLTELEEQLVKSKDRLKQEVLQ
jgi:peptidoglycan hydrolase CwlO-like protein